MLLNGRSDGPTDFFVLLKNGYRVDKWQQFFSFIIFYWKTHINVFWYGQFSRKLFGILVYSIFKPLQLSILRLATCWLLKGSQKKIEIRTWCSIHVLLLECRETLAICFCFDILISFSIGYISTQWKALFKSVFNIVVLNLCI